MACSLARDVAANRIHTAVSASTIPAPTIIQPRFGILTRLPSVLTRSSHALRSVPWSHPRDDLRRDCYHAEFPATDICAIRERTVRSVVAGSPSRQQSATDTGLGVQRTARWQRQRVNTATVRPTWRRTSNEREPDAQVHGGRQQRTDTIEPARRLTPDCPDDSLASLLFLRD